MVMHRGRTWSRTWLKPLVGARPLRPGGRQGPGRAARVRGGLLTLAAGVNGGGGAPGGLPGAPRRRGLLLLLLGPLGALPLLLLLLLLGLGLRGLLPRDGAKHGAKLKSDFLDWAKHLKL